MSRDHKILAASGILGLVVAIAKSGATSTDDMIAAAKGEVVPLGVNLVGLFILFKLIKS